MLEAYRRRIFRRRVHNLWLHEVPLQGGLQIEDEDVRSRVPLLASPWCNWDLQFESNKSELPLVPSLISDELNKIHRVVGWACTGTPEPDMRSIRLAIPSRARVIARL